MVCTAYMYVYKYTSTMGTTSRLTVHVYNDIRLA